jgi:hypothetical protein
MRNSVSMAAAKMMDAGTETQPEESAVTDGPDDGESAPYAARSHPARAHNEPLHRRNGRDGDARAVEERGLDSLFVAEHTHIPIDTKSRYPAGGEIPGKYLPHPRPVRDARHCTSSMRQIGFRDINRWTRWGRALLILHGNPRGQAEGGPP